MMKSGFFAEWSDEMAYVLGFFSADGYMIKNKRGGHFIDFYSIDRPILEEIRNIVGASQVISTRIRPGMNISYRLQIGSKAWFGDLTRLGLIQNKSKTIRLPDIPRIHLPHFVRGYFDGDGCVHLGRYWRKDRKQWKWQFTTRFTSGSRRFLEDLHGILLPYMKGGFISKKMKNGLDGGYDLVFGRADSLALFRLMYHNRESDCYLRRKHKIFQKAFRILSMRA